MITVQITTQIYSSTILEAGSPQIKVSHQEGYVPSGGSMSSLYWFPEATMFHGPFLHLRGLQHVLESHLPCLWPSNPCVRTLWLCRATREVRVMSYLLMLQRNGRSHMFSLGD